jgi:Phosphatidylethanolamine-binding protein
VTIAVWSSAFEAVTTMPKKHTGEGQDVSPPLRWNSIPQGTKEIAIICDDPDSPTHNPFVHWVTLSSSFVRSSPHFTPVHGLIHLRLDLRTGGVDLGSRSPAMADHSRPVLILFAATPALRRD